MSKPIDHTEGGPAATASSDAVDAADFDALAELFLDDHAGAPSLRLTSDEDESPEADEPVATAPSRRGQVEGLVLGHLPVLAGAWASQHARSEAEATNAPVAMLRLAAGQTLVQVFLPPTDHRELDRAKTLDEALRAAAALDPLWMIRAEAPSELDLATEPGLHRLTVLAGADETSIVAAYRTLKGLKKSLAPAEERIGPGLCLRIMGAPRAKAEDAASRVGRAAEAFLDLEVDAAAGPSRIGTGGPVTLHRADETLSPVEALRRLRAALTAAAPVETEPAAVASERVAEPAPVLEPEPTPDLPEQLGLTPMASACVAAPGVRMAVDDAGRVHLLARGERALEALTAASAWTRAHLPILRAAEGDRVSADLAPALHLFTDEPVDVRPMLDAEVRVHLLAPVRVGAETAWLCKPLNALASHRA